MNTENMSNEAEKPALNKGDVISSAIVMACGSRHSCEHCTHYYMRSCSYINRMNNNDYEAHEKLVKAAL